ncbi:angiogenic factor with G patch and FHA domains 1 isoform X1 [Schistocerca cancellata]|uniref:angiogenic factor with G patch and FHA domains 1 isoform X1 n=1 Tax=Schistocerca cancellata TaxID=274614 RepID=UPI00211945B1|nr:angiogenic factor with G patch and FHA domains 1 isoform X1 [Schistocerca cancellata]
MTEGKLACTTDEVEPANNTFSEPNKAPVYNDTLLEVFSLNENVIDQFQEELQTLPEVLSYINYLQMCVQKQNLQLRILTHRIKEYESQLTKRCETLEKATQTETDEVVDTPWITGSSQSETLSLAEQVKEAAESALQSTNFVYEETSGMYYDYTTGYYYDAERGLYYDGNNGIYYSYDSGSGEYLFHSQIEQNQNVPYEAEEKKRKKLNKKISKENKKSKTEEITNDDCGNEGKQDRDDSREEGECSDSSPDDSSSNSSNSDELKENLLDSDCSKAYPPCMRIVVKETNVEKLKIGTLFIVTYTGGTLGREGDHSVLIPDINVSKFHAKLSFDDGKYSIIDFGSRNGTYLNGARLSACKQESEPFEVVHGSILQVGGTKLLCHIHLGHDTCGHCEPGLLQQVSSDRNEEKLTKRSISYKSGLKQLQRKLCPRIPDPRGNDDTRYQDRAELRRCTVGSQNENEKTYTASLDEPIKSDNKGFKLLSKMGWSEGEPLGKEKAGSTEPIPLSEQRGTAGLGSDAPPPPPSGDAAAARRSQRWKKAKQRYEALS